MNKYVDFKAFRKDAESALEELGKRYGLDIKAGNISYDSTEFKMQLICTRADVDVERIKFDENVRYMTGFTSDDYGRVVEIRSGRSSHKYTIKGFKPGNKYSVLLTREDGAEYGYTAEAVLAALGRIS